MVLSTIDGAAPGADPFFERTVRSFCLNRQILGGRFRFCSDSEALLRLADAAYSGLPEHRLPHDCPDFDIELRLVNRHGAPPVTGPPPVAMQSGAGLICGVMDAANYVVLAPQQRRALIVAADDMLGSPYHLRYELLEFAVFVLASRALNLVPLHGACVGHQGRGVLLLGHSGSGKSTLALCSVLQGLDFLAEDAVFVQPQTLLATGVANYLHLRSDALRFVDDDAARRWISNAPVICRRNGVRKFEADLRRGPGVLARHPMVLTGVVFVASQAAPDGESLLSRLPEESLAARLSADQPYAAGQEGWAVLTRQLMQLGIHELRRAAHPRMSVAALQSLLA